MARRPGLRPRDNTEKKMSLGSVLDQIGAKPIGNRIKIKVGIRQPSLRRQGRRPLIKNNDMHICKNCPERGTAHD
jgi:hypothetical protein